MHDKRRATIRDITDGGNRRQVEAFAREVAGKFDVGIAQVRVTASPEVVNVRTVTLQLVDRNGAPLKERWMARVWVATTAFAAPGGTQTVAVTAGTIFQTIVGNQHYLIMTDANGTITLDVTVSGLGTRHIHAYAIAPIDTTGALGWAL